MKRVQKYISICLLLSLILSLCQATGGFARTWKDLTEIRPIEMPANWTNFMTIDYWVPERESQLNLSLDEVMDKEDFQYVLDVFSAENLVYERPATDDGEKNVPSLGHFKVAEQNELSTNWHFNFDETSVYVRKIDIGIDITSDFYHAWFTWKDDSVFAELESVLKTWADERMQQIEDIKTAPLKNEEWISDIEIICQVFCPCNKVTEFWWGFCSYMKDGQKIIAPFNTLEGKAELDGELDILLGEMIGDNTIYFDMTKALYTYDSGKNGRVYDCSDVPYQFTYKIQVDVTKDGKVEEMDVICDFIRRPINDIIPEIDMSRVEQTGSLLGFFEPGEDVVTEKDPNEVEKPDNENPNEVEEVEPDTEKPGTEVEEEPADPGTADETEDDPKEETPVEPTEPESPQTPEVPADTTPEDQPEPDRADALQQLGLFRGTENGYELESTFTRAQGATMVVRLLGKEQEALATTPQGIFADVPAEDWAAPYVEYCYQNGITKGTGESSYSPEDAMTGAQYLTLVLRALGYNAVEPENADNAAVDCGLTDRTVAEEICQTEALTRDTMVYISYQALSVKDPYGVTLIEKLAEAQAVDTSVAKALGLIE